MKIVTVIFAAIVFCALSSAYAVFSLGLGGEWPKSWPKELESLRKQASTENGPRPGDVTYHITFNSQREFEAAWPSILKVRREGTPLTLLRNPGSPVDTAHATVNIYCDSFAIVDGQVGGEVNPKMRAASISVTVDGHIVDLNRIPLPANTSIIDKRFNESQPSGIEPGKLGGSKQTQLPVCPPG